MRRIAEGFELPGDWGFFTNDGMTLDTASPLFGLGSARYDAANVEFATAPILDLWAAYYIWTGLHFKMANPASSSPNWIFGWRTEQTIGNVVESGCVGVMDSRLCLALGVRGGPGNIISVGRKVLLSDLIYHLQAEIWHAASFGWVKLKINNRVIPDLVFNGVTALATEPLLSGIWIGSLYGGGSGICRIDDFLLNDQQPFQNQDRGWTGMGIVHSKPSNGNGIYTGWDDDPPQKYIDTPLAELGSGVASGVAGTPVACDNTLSATVPCAVSVEGPITNPSFENQDTSESVSITGVVPSGSRLVCNTQSQGAYLLSPGPGTTLITEDWSPFINASPEWFTLTPGVNNILVSGASGNVVTVGWIAYEIGPMDSFTFGAKPAPPTPPTGTAGLVSMDHVYRMKVEGSIARVIIDKVVPGIRRSSVDAWEADVNGHLYPNSVLAGHIDRMRRDRFTISLWNPANIDSTEAIFQYANYGQATAQPSTEQPPATGQQPAPSESPTPTPTPLEPPTQPPVSQPPPPDIVNDPPPPIVVGGNTFVASLSGSDTNPGTESLPVRTIGKLATLLFPRDIGLLRGGNYNVAIRTDTMAFRSGNSWSEPITVANYPGEVPQVRSAGVVTAVRYLVFHGLLIDGENIEYETVYLHGGSYIRFRVCRITRGGDQGILVPHGYDIGHEFIECEVYNNGFGSHLRLMASHGPKYCHGMYLSGSNTLVERCLIHDNSGYGLHNYNGYTSSTPSDVSQNNIFRFNKIYSNGVTLAPSDGASALIMCGRNSVAHHNLIYRNRGGMQMAYGGTPTNLAFYFNTVAFNGASPYLSIIDAYNCLYRNNIFYGNSGSLVVVGSSGTVATNNLTADPSFVNSSGGDFHLNGGSAAIGAGVAISGLTLDFDGVTHANPPAAGAFEP